MKTSDFNQPLSSATLKENIGRQFGVNVNLDKYNREQLEDFRNKLRTRIFQHEGRAGINDLLTNETYQKDKAMLELLNTRIKEMLGEDIKKLKDKLVALDEAKKGVRDMKHTTKTKGTMANKDYDGDGKIETNKDEVWGSRAKAAAKAGKPFSESSDDDERGGDQDTKSKFNKQEIKPGVVRHTRKSSTFTSEPHRDTGSSARTKADTQAKADDEADRAKYTGLRKVRKDGETQYFYNGKKIDQDRYERIASRPSAVGEAAEKKCNHTPKGKKCPVHGLKECGMGVYEGEDEGKPGKNFAKIAKSAGKRYGSKEAGERVAGAVRNKLKKQGKLEESQQIFKHNVRVVNESLAYLLSENEEEKAKSITAAGDIVNDFTSWMQRVGQYQTKSMIELSDKIRADFGPAEAEAFKQAVGPALSSALEMLTQQREAISNAVATLAGEQMPTNPMGSEPEMPVAEPDMMNEPEGGDEFAAADAAAGGDEVAGRDLRESRVKARLRESHSIISKLAR